MFTSHPVQFYPVQVSHIHVLYESQNRNSVGSLRLLTVSTEITALLSDLPRYFLLLLAATKQNSTNFSDINAFYQVCVFSGLSENKDGRPCLRLADMLFTSPLQPLNGIQRNFTGKNGVLILLNVLLVLILESDVRVRLTRSFWKRQTQVVGLLSLLKSASLRSYRQCLISYYQDFDGYFDGCGPVPYPSK